MNGYAPRRILGPAACWPTCFRCATLIKRIRASIYECRFLESSHHASNMGVCNYNNMESRNSWDVNDDSEVIPCYEL